MTIDWIRFTPWQALAGGVLLGLATIVLLFANGRVAGISGIVGALITGESGAGWRVAFLLGLMATPSLWAVWHNGFFPHSAYLPDSPEQWVKLAVGGFLVGFGTRLANGCTSGHGICGLARCSQRSWVAVLVFMTAGIGTVLVTRHGLGF